MSKLKRLARAVTPPVIWRASSSLYRTLSPEHPIRWTPDAEGMTDVPVKTPEVIEYLVGRPVFSIPTSRLRYPGGVPYAHEHHHFLRYYRGGMGALRHHYERHQPRNVLERHFLKTPTGRDIPDGWAPWLLDLEETPEGRECGLGPEHGNQAFGPVSEEKLRLEASRLDSVLESIEHNGFLPGLGGYPRGYFLIAPDGEWVTVVREGFHRVAAMVHLGFPSVPLQFHTAYPRTVKENECAEWPMVADQSLTKQEASDIFRQYFTQIPDRTAFYGP